MSCYNLKTSMKLHNYYLSEPFLFADCIHVLVVVVVAVAVVMLLSFGAHHMIARVDHTLGLVCMLISLLLLVVLGISQVGTTMPNFSFISLR